MARVKDDIPLRQAIHDITYRLFEDDDGEMYEVCYDGDDAISYLNVQVKLLALYANRLASLKQKVLAEKKISHWKSERGDEIRHTLAIGYDDALTDIAALLDKEIEGL